MDLSDLTRLPYNLYCVGGDVKHSSIQLMELMVWLQIVRVSPTLVLRTKCVRRLQTRVAESADRYLSSEQHDRIEEQMNECRVDWLMTTTIAYNNEQNTMWRVCRN